MRIATISWLAVLSLTSGATFLPVALAGVVDFQTPILAVPAMPANPYIASGVVFTDNSGALSLIREADFTPGMDPSDPSQLVMSYPSLMDLSPPTIRADLDGVPGNAVMTVSVRMGSTPGEGQQICLRLFNASDVLVGSTCMSWNHLGPGLKMLSRSPLTVTAGEPVAYALMSLDLEPGVECSQCEGRVAIDDFEFSDSTVGLVPASWGSLKVRHR